MFTISTRDFYEPKRLKTKTSLNFIYNVTQFGKNIKPAFKICNRQYRQLSASTINTQLLDYKAHQNETLYIALPKTNFIPKNLKSNPFRNN